MCVHVYLCIASSQVSATNDLLLVDLTEGVGIVAVRASQQGTIIAWIIVYVTTTYICNVCVYECMYVCVYVISMCIFLCLCINVCMYVRM